MYVQPRFKAESFFGAFLEKPSGGKFAEIFKDTQAGERVNEGSV